MVFALRSCFLEEANLSSLSKSTIQKSFINYVQGNFASRNGHKWDIKFLVRLEIGQGFWKANRPSLAQFCGSTPGLQLTNTAILPLFQAVQTETVKAWQLFWIGKYVETHRARHFFIEIMQQRFDIYVVFRNKRVKQFLRGTLLETMKTCDFLFLALLGIECLL